MKPYDATMKQLLDDFARDWIEWLGPMLGLSPTTPLALLDTDLSIVQFTPDKVFQLEPKSLGIMHLELQSSHDLDMPERMLVYNTLLEFKHKQTVSSVLILLRPEADAKSITGELTRHRHDKSVYKTFKYEVIRVWELPGEKLLHGHWGTVPLAFLTDDARGHLPEWARKLEERFEIESISESKRQSLLLSSCILCGLRYNATEIEAAFPGVNAMRESVIYQKILKEGRQEGEIKGRQEGLLEGRQEGLLEGVKACQQMLTDILSDRFGKLRAELQARIQGIQDLPRLQAAVRNAIRIQSLDELQL